MASKENIALMAHLMRRAGFGATREEIEARADQGGVSFWLPGAFGSLAATPLVPGWSLGAIYLHSSMVGRRQCGSVAGDRLPQ